MLLFCRSELKGAQPCVGEVSSRDAWGFVCQVACASCLRQHQLQHIQSSSTAQESVYQSVHAAALPGSSCSLCVPAGDGSQLLPRALVCQETHQGWFVAQRRIAAAARCAFSSAPHLLTPLVLAPPTPLTPLVLAPPTHLTPLVLAPPTHPHPSLR